MKVHITSDGTARGTKIITPDGIDLSKYASRIDICIKAGKLAVATIEIPNVTVDVLAELKTPFAPRKTKKGKA